MSINSRIQLKGNLGKDPKVISAENGKEFIALSIATTDSYMDKESKTWKNKETVWHDVLIFKPTSLKFAKELRKGDRIYIDGALSYKQVESKEGHKINQASIIANFVAKAPLLDKQDEQATE